MGALHRFSTEHAAPGARPDLFQQQMAQLFSVGLAIAAPDEPFQTQMTAYCGRRLRFAALRFSPHETSSAHASAGPSSRMLLSLHDQGTVVVQQDGRESRIEPGDFFMIDPTRPFAIETGAIATRSVYLEPSTLRTVLPELDGLTARTIGGRQGPGALFRGVVDQMFAMAESIDEPAADRIADALPHMLAAALTPLLGEAAAMPTRLRAMHRQRIRRYVHENLRRHDLDAADVAAGVNLSRRYVYELCEQDGQPLMKWIWSTRLERCHRDLSSPAFQSRSIGQIAYHWGFGDLAHFSRAFKQRYGVSPREFRARVALP